MIATLSFALLLISMIIQAVYLFRKDEAKDPLSPWLALGAGVLLLTEIIRRSIAIHFVALTSMFESLLFMACLVSFIVFALRYSKRLRAGRAITFGATALPIIFLALASSPLAPAENAAARACPPIGMARAPCFFHLHRRGVFRRRFRERLPPANRENRGKAQELRPLGLHEHSDRLPHIHRGSSRVSEPSGRKKHGECGGAGIPRKPGR